MAFMGYYIDCGECLKNAVLFLLCKYVKPMCRGIFQHAFACVNAGLQKVGFPAAF
jgi:hypothetical protein